MDSGSLLLSGAHGLYVADTPCFLKEQQNVMLDMLDQPKALLVQQASVSATTM